MNDAIFAKNLSLLSEKNAALADAVRKVGPPTPKVFPDDAQNQWDSLDLSSTQALFVYGIGNGKLYLAARQWLKGQDRFLAFIEDDIAVIAHLLATELGTEILGNLRVRIFYLPVYPVQPDVIGRFFEHFGWYYNLLGYQSIALPSYANDKPDLWKILRDSIKTVMQEVRQQSMQHLALGKEFITNMYANLPAINGAYEFKGLKGKFKDIPAIVCGAGPSLLKQLPLLSGLKNKAVIFASGSSLPLMNGRQFEPHFSASIDPNPPFQRFYWQTSFECAFFYHLSSSHDIAMLMHGPRIVVSGAQAQVMEKWLTEQLDIRPELLEYHITVGQLAMKMAHYLGCSPILLLGMDYALTEKKYYSAGIDTASTQVSEKEQSLIILPDIYGRPVQTKWDWEHAVMQVAEMVKDMHPNPFINCTEGGLGFKGIPNVPFADAVQKHLLREHDILGHVHTHIENAERLHLSQESKDKLFLQIGDSLKRCIALSEDLIMELHTLIKDNSAVPAGTLPITAQHLYNELSQEVIFKEVLDPFWQVFSKSMHRYVDALELTFGKDSAALRYKLEEINFYHLAAQRHLAFLLDAVKQ